MFLLAWSYILWYWDYGWKLILFFVFGVEGVCVYFFIVLEAYGLWSLKFVVWHTRIPLSLLFFQI